MTGIAFYFEDNDADVWSGRQIDLDQWMRLVLCYGYDNIAVIDLSTGKQASFNGNQSVPIEFFTSSADFMMAYGTDKFTVFECPWNPTTRSKIMMWDYDHTTDRDWHCFGPSGGWASTALKNNTNGLDIQIVSIPQANQDPQPAIYVASIVGAHMHNIRNP